MPEKHKRLREPAKRSPAEIELAGAFHLPSTPLDNGRAAYKEVGEKDIGPAGGLSPNSPSIRPSKNQMR
jgi:hypothetical protein